MSFGGSVRVCLRKFAVFSGRARPSEYWWFVLLLVVVAVPLGVVSELLARSGLDGALGLLVLAWLVLLIPWWAVSVRRLHDTGHSGWWLLIPLVPVAGWLILIFFLASRGEPGPNRYGAVPSAPSHHKTAVPVVRAAAAPSSYETAVTAARGPDPHPERARVPPEGLAALKVPHPHGEIVKRLEGGQEVLVIERREAWALIREVDGGTWWIDGRRLV
jgi:uncharacterized membrane protein YhaH (DUF805 family)